MENFLNSDLFRYLLALIIGGGALLSFKFIFKKNSSQKIKSGDNSVNIQSQGDFIINGGNNDK